ncbi:hypothetical protein GKQ77_17955 [Streptomyces sp. BG9H]|uniref:Uncharacterized protein n=1 Tax=Streptomyces anatolicus TaxID=2675858 RepID=A0ABS6YQX2_9ACTN|nr:hypothetical protein [Streptomyces anatolicus]
MRAVCRSIAAHTISCFGWSASLWHRPTMRTAGLPVWFHRARKRTPERSLRGPSSQLSRLDSNQ